MPVPIIRSLRLMLAVSTLLVSSAPAARTGVVPAGEPQGLVLVGSATLRWFGLKVYEIEYYETQSGCDTRLLKITYARKISATRLIDITREQWAEIGVPFSESTQSWLEQAGAFWPNVQPGDFIAMAVDAAGTAWFHGTRGHLGAIEDPQFSRAFLGIWLSPETTQPRLRKQLLQGGSRCPEISY